jgi:hypothetical protein
MEESLLNEILIFHGYPYPAVGEHLKFADLFVQPGLVCLQS